MGTIDIVHGVRAIGTRGMRAAVFVHGLGSTTDRCAEFIDALEGLYDAVVTCDYCSITEPGAESAAALAEALLQLAPAADVDIFGHSKGGLVATLAVFANLRGTKMPIRSVVAINSPFGGATASIERIAQEAGHLLDPGGVVGATVLPGAWELVYPDTEWGICALLDALTCPRSVRFVSIGSYSDGIVDADGATPDPDGYRTTHITFARQPGEAELWYTHRGILDHASENGLLMVIQTALAGELRADDGLCHLADGCGVGRKTRHGVFELCEDCARKLFPCPCSKCDGDGIRLCEECAGETSFGCETCRGDGHMPCEACNEDELGPLQCEDCGGDGAILCGECEGEGIVAHERCDGEGCQYCGDGCVKCKACRGRCEYGCKACKGTGKEPSCPTCDDQRVVVCPDCKDHGYVDCEACSGSGKRRCDDCGGTGRV